MQANGHQHIEILSNVIWLYHKLLIDFILKKNNANNDPNHNYRSKSTAVINYELF